MSSVVSSTAASVVTAAVARTTAAPRQESLSIFWLTLSLAYSTILLLQRITFTITKFLTYTLPTWLFTLFSMSLTFTMNFTTL